MVFAYCFVRGSGSPPGRGNIRCRCHPCVLLPLVAVAVLFFLIDLLLRKSAEYGRPDRLQGFVYHLFWYLASPLAAFNEFLTTFDGRYHLGQYMFFPFYKWLCRFHLAPETDISVFGEFVLIPYAGERVHLPAELLRGLRHDRRGGGALRPRPGQSPCCGPGPARYFPYLNLYLVLLVFILFSFYNYFLFSNQVYLQILFGFLFFRYETATKTIRLRYDRHSLQSRRQVAAQ